MAKGETRAVRTARLDAKWRRYTSKEATQRRAIAGSEANRKIGNMARGLSQIAGVMGYTQRVHLESQAKTSAKLSASSGKQRRVPPGSPRGGEWTK